MLERAERDMFQEGYELAACAVTWKLVVDDATGRIVSESDYSVGDTPDTEAGQQASLTLEVRHALQHVTIDTGDSPDEAKALLVRGIATLETVDGIPDEYLAAARISMDESDRAEFERGVQSVYEQMVRISIEPQWARFYDFGAGRLPAFLADLVNKG